MKLVAKIAPTLVLLPLIIACGSKLETTAESASDEASTVSTEKQAVCIWKEVSVKEAPEEKGKYKTTIYLGEKITFLGDTATDASSDKKNKFIKVKLVDNTEGWVRQDFVAIDATAAAFANEAMIYKRPDIMTPSGKNFQMMDFVAVKSTQGEWSEVIGKRVGDTWFSSGWVKSESLTNQDVDVAVSVFYSRAMEIPDEQKREAEIQKIFDNQDLRNSMFYTILTGAGEEEVIEDGGVEEEVEETGEETDEQ